MGPVERDQLLEVDVTEIIGVDDDDLLGAFGEVGVGGDRAGRAEQLGLEGLGQVETAVGIIAIDVGSDLLGVRVGVDPRLPDPGVGEPIDPGAEQSGARRS